MALKQFTKENINSLKCEDFRKKPLFVQATQIGEEFEVVTLEGTMKGKAGDFLVRGITGEIYPVDYHIFRKSYDPV